MGDREARGWSSFDVMVSYGNYLVGEIVADMKRRPVQCLRKETVGLWLAMTTAQREKLTFYLLRVLQLDQTAFTNLFLSIVALELERTFGQLPGGRESS